MPSAPQGLYQFEGLTAILGGTYTRSHGVSPGAAVLECAPQDGLVTDVADLSFTFGGVTLPFPDCKVDRATIRYDSQGKVWQVTVYDRRWKWISFGGGNAAGAPGEISGSYNLLMGDNEVDPAREKTPQALCKLCLDAMGETGYDVSQVPNDTRPPVEWADDNPAQALDALCAKLGCRIVLRLDNTVLLARIGVGQSLPDAPTGDNAIVSDSLAITVPRAPDNIKFVAGPTLWQDSGSYSQGLGYLTGLILEAVGVEPYTFDPQTGQQGQIKPIDQLSYRPPNGWGGEVVNVFAGVTSVAGQAAAKRTVFRWYRVKTPITVVGYQESLTPPGPAKVKVDLKQILPLDDLQIVTEMDGGLSEDLFNESTARIEAQIFGTFFKGGLGYVNSNPKTQYEYDWELDRELGIVKFSDYVFKYVPPPVGGGTQYQKIAPADLILVTAFTIRRKPEWYQERWSKTFPTGLANGTGPRILKHDEVQLQILDGRPQNKDVLDRVAGYYNDAALLDYQTTTPQERTYGGLLDAGSLDLDGAIQQITYTVGLSGCTTRASRNNEWNPAVPSYQERRILEITVRERLQRISDLAEKANRDPIARLNWNR